MASRSIVAVAKLMRRQGLTLVTAESCTAGLIAATLADLKGAGELLDCAFVTYSPEAKRRCLSVKAKTLATCNLTSEAVAREMALGALRRGNANLAVSNTGVTDDVDPDVPAGTQCYAWAFRQHRGDPWVLTGTRRFKGGRLAIRQQSAEYALRHIAAAWRQWSATGR